MTVNEDLKIKYHHFDDVEQIYFEDLVPFFLEYAEENKLELSKRARNILKTIAKNDLWYLESNCLLDSYSINLCRGQRWFTDPPRLKVELDHSLCFEFLAIYDAIIDDIKQERR